jgi:pimeloyl-ACP methyl ester carboxylesterase/heme-degrading monooxygenase HmoA
MTEATFFNVWRTSSRENQERLLDAMRAEAPELQSKRGFVELTAWKGEADDLRVLVEGRWESAAAFETAVANNPAALKSREKLAQLGTPEAGLFRQAFRVQPAPPMQEGSRRALPGGITEHDIAVNGQSIHYLRAGTGPLMVLVHGYPESSRTWLKVMPELAKHFTVVAPDTRGTGDSSIARGFAISDIAGDVYALVRALGFRELILVGQDFGVQVVGAYAALHREDVRALVAMESPLSGFGLEDLFGALWHFGFFRSPYAEMLIQGREDEFFRTFAFGDFVYRKSAFAESDIEEYIRNQKRPGRLAAGFDYYRALGKAKEFFEKTVAPPWNFPVLAMDGDRSLSGLTASSFARIQPGLKSMLVPESGHFVQEEQPDFLAGALLDFTSAFRDR